MATGIDHGLVTTPTEVFILQALLGVENLPAALRLGHFLPAVHRDLVVDTTAGPVHITETAEYASLMAKGVIDGSGAVDEAVRDWMTVVGNPDREVMLVIRRPDPQTAGTAAPTVHERAIVICRHEQRWLAQISRCDDEVVLDAVGESRDPATQVSLMCNTLIPALGMAEPADIEGVNIPAEVLTAAVSGAAGGDERSLRHALGALGIEPAVTRILVAIGQMDQSALGVVCVSDHGVDLHVHPRVVTIADTEYGRVSITSTQAADGRQWMSIWPATPAGVRDDLAALLSVPPAA